MRLSRVVAIGLCALECVLKCVSETVHAQTSPLNPAPAIAPAAVTYVSTPYAWDVSLALEGARDLLGAQTVMRYRYGLRPGTYAPCVRLAWLALQLGEYNEAVTLYRRALDLERSEGEAPKGLAIALSHTGFVMMDKGEFANARRAFGEAHALDSTQTDAAIGLSEVGYANELAPEVWVGRLLAASRTSTANVLYVSLPLRINAAYTLRAAVRTVTGAATSVAGGTSFFGAQHEVFVGGGYEIGGIGVDATLFRLANDYRTNSGGAVAVRIGGTTGVTATGSIIQSGSGSNLQLSPLISRWFSPHIRLAAGVRFTSDSSLTGISGLAGVTVRNAHALVDLRVHGGTERWAFDMAGPTILSFNAATLGGATATVAVPLTRALTLNIQGEGEKFATSASVSGWYTSFAVGMRFTMADTKYGTSRR